MKSGGTPINPNRTALNAGAKPSFGTNPFTSFGGMRGGFDPGMPYAIPGLTPFMNGMNGMKGCGCGPVGGCGCSGASGLDGYVNNGYGNPTFYQTGAGGGFGKLGQSPSLDQIIQNTTSWLGSFATSQLPATAAVPPGYGTTGNIVTQLINYAPYLLIGYLAFKALK